MVLTAPMLALKVHPLSAYSFVQWQPHGFGAFDDYKLSLHQRQRSPMAAFDYSRFKKVVTLKKDGDTDHGR
jgi:hypothetical protein